MTGNRTTTDPKRTGDWEGEEWAGGDPRPDRSSSTEWNKTEWAGDQGKGAPAPMDPDQMPEGETSISGGRHGSGEQHWAKPAADPATRGDADNPTR